MHLGDNDGRGVVYDRFGAPILEEREIIDSTRTAEALALFEGKRAKGQPLIHHGQGEVGMTMTDRRLIILVDPSLTSARDVLKLPGDESWTKGMELFEVIQGRGRYYLVLSWDEIPKVKVPSSKKATATVPVKSAEGGTYTMLMDRESAAWIERSWKAHR
ncbi:MAG: hypothetical protein JSW25_03805 [Thermoplasmata archaeon]|nr:MAG: hypothetical protein JSW25_03805 [Thermoplasmata archaeon]